MKASRVGWLRRFLSAALSLACCFVTSCSQTDHRSHDTNLVINPMSFLAIAIQVHAMQYSTGPMEKDPEGACASDLDSIAYLHI